MDIKKIKNTIQVQTRLSNEQQHDNIALADKIYDEGFENIFFAGSGGSITTLMAFQFYFKKYSRIPAYYEMAAELMKADYKQLNSKSLVVIMAKTGTMVETVELSQFCKERGIKTLGFVIFDNTPVANNVTYKVIINEFDNAARYIAIYQVLFRLMYRNGDYSNYEGLLNALKKTDKILENTIDGSCDLAYKLGNDYAKEPFQLYLYSGANQGEVAKYSADVAEEVFRMKTQFVHTSEFFHGCLEIADNDLCIVLVKSVDESRDIDERCHRFLEKYANKKLVVFDPKNINMQEVDPEYRTFFVPMMINVFLCTLVSENMKSATGLGLGTRRYYQKVEY